jgi:hypothetical protein
MFCQYCNREAKTSVSKSQHELYCKSNPNAKKKVPSYGMLGKAGSNQYIKGTAKPLSSESRNRISEANKRRVWSDEKRQRHSTRMKEAVENNPDSYTSSNRGRTKQIEFDGIKFQGNWELEFYKWAKVSGLNPKRCTEGFHYNWNGDRTYYPDFYIELKDLYVEVKGFKTERDSAKWNQFPKKLLVVDKVAIDRIKKGSYSLPLIM